MMLKNKLEQHQRELADCRACPDMVPPSVVCGPVVSKVLLIGQAPGDKEPKLQRPFAWTAGKTLFKWLASIGLEEEAFRSKVYMAAVCRCFPRKNPKGGDRVPTTVEIERCGQWLQAERQLLQPELLLPVGKLAISQFLECGKLVDVIGEQYQMSDETGDYDLIPLPHPSGASTWHRTEPGITLLRTALQLIEQHPAWRQLFK